MKTCFISSNTVYLPPQNCLSSWKQNNGSIFLYLSVVLCVTTCILPCFLCYIPNVQLLVWQDAVRLSSEMVTNCIKYILLKCRYSPISYDKLCWHFCSHETNKGNIDFSYNTNIPEQTVLFSQKVPKSVASYRKYVV